MTQRESKKSVVILWCSFEAPAFIRREEADLLDSFCSIMSQSQ